MLNSVLSYLRFATPILILLLVLLSNGLGTINWGYDEFGAIVTHLEIDDQYYVNIYKGYLIDIGISNPTILGFFVDYILPIIVVPLRWTYAIGISPLLGLSRIVNIDWPLLGNLFLLPNIALATIGVYLIALSIKIKKQSQNVMVLFISFILLSHPFLKWTLTLTSYSYHLFCFGLLLYSEVNLNHNGRVLSKLSLSRSIVQIFNYQYIVIVATLGLAQLIKNPRSFFNEKKYLGWIVPAIVALASIVFLVVRSVISGKHDNPAFTALGDNVERYRFSDNSSDLASSIEYLVARLLDFLHYFFIEASNFYSSSVYSEVSFVGLIAFLSSLIFIYFKILNKVDAKLKQILMVFCFALLVPYLLSLQPTTATRHALVFLLPISLFFSLTIYSICEFIFLKKYITVASSLLLVLATYNAIGFNQYKARDLNIDKAIPILQKNNVKHLVLSPCEYRPLLYTKIRGEFKVFYRCGDKIIRKLVDPQIRRVAVLSEEKITVDDAKSMIASYSDEKWISIYRQTSSGDAVDSKRYKSNLFVFAQQMENK
jgi:hypothetical protein